MNDVPTVSVIVIFFNEERFLLEAVDSVRDQTFDDWELLLCDDGSTDASSALARQLSDTDARISYLEHPAHVNRGMSATRNLGLRVARGRYVALLDADDVWLSNKLEEQVQLMDEHPDAGMVCGAPQYWRSWSGERSGDRLVPVGAPQEALVHPPRLMTMLYPLGDGHAPCPSDLLLRRSIVNEVGGFEEQFRGDRQLYEDQAFLAKLYLHAAVYVSGSTWIRYRERPDSCVASVSAAGQYHVVRRYFLLWLGDYLKDHGVTDRSVLSAWAKADSAYRWPSRTSRALGRRTIASRALGRRIIDGLRRRLPAA